jgi:hypothetical protein
MEELRKPSSPFALRAKDIIPFHSEEPNWATLASAKEEIQSITGSITSGRSHKRKQFNFGCNGKIHFDF